MNWRDKIAAEMAEYKQEYSHYSPMRRAEKLAEQRAWLESLVRIQRIWELLVEVWDSRDDQLGWAVYWNLKKRDGDVPNPDDLTVEHIRDGLLLEWPNDERWQAWVEREYVAYRDK